MLPLLASLVALGSAPVLDRLLRGRRALGAAVDAFAAVAVAALVVVQVAPHAIVAAGGWGVAAVLIGTLLPAGSHHVRGGERAVLVLATAALALHGLLDGAVLADIDGPEALGHAIVLHSLPVGLGTWRAVRAEHGVRTAAAVLGVALAAQLAGYGLAGALPHDAASLALAQGFVAGSLLHVVAHARHADAPAATGVGALAGAGVAAVVAVEHPLPARFASELDLAGTLVGLATEAAPALLVGLGAHAAAARGPAWARALVARGAPGFVPVALAAPWLGAGWAVAWALLAAAVAAAAPRPPAPPPPGIPALLAPLLVGWVLAGLLEPLAAPGVLADTPPAAEVLGAALVGGLAAPLLPALVPLAAVLAHKGLAPAAVGVLLAVPTLRRSGLSPRTRVVAAGACTGAGLAVSGVGAVTPLHELARHAHGPVEHAALGVAAAVIAATLVARGLDAFTDALRFEVVDP